MGEVVFALVGTLIGAAVGLAVGALVGALLVQAATRIVLKFTPPYGMAYKAAFIAGSGSFAIGFPIGYFAGEQLSTGVFVGLVFAGLLIQSFVYAVVIKDADHKALGFNRGLLVALMQLLLFAAIVAVLIGIIALIRVLL